MQTKTQRRFVSLALALGLALPLTGQAEPASTTAGLLRQELKQQQTVLFWIVGLLTLNFILS